MKKLNLLLVFLLVPVIFVVAQKAPIKYGTVSKEELLNNRFEPDTSAPAVVLCDYGYYSDDNFQTRRILRIKFFKKEGLSYANQVIFSDDQTSVRGITYNYENDKIVETKLKQESVFKTRITDDRYQYRIAMPNVKVGSIIDIEIVYDLIPDSWDFQLEIPVVRSELVMMPSRYITFRKNYFGYLPLSITEPDRWVAVNMPAFKTEPYLSSSKNFRTRFEFDIANISIPGRYYKSYSASWEDVRDRLLESTYFGTVLNADGYISSRAKEIAASSSTKEEKLQKAFDFVKNVKWDESERLFTDATGLNSVLKAGKGNSAEINLMLVQLLRKLDFNAMPVVLSTRSNGRLAAFPSISKLNYVIAGVFSNTDTLLLDATEKNCPKDLLPFRVLNGAGQVINKNYVGWIPLIPKKKDMKMTVYNLQLQDDMTMKGQLQKSFDAYAALDFRNDYETFNSDDEYLKDFREDKTGVTVLNHKITNLDSLNKPVTEEFELELKDAANDVGGEIYFYPMMFEQMKENPFKASERKYPIDFGYQGIKTVISNFTLPEGYTVSSVPASVLLKLPDNSASFSFKSANENGVLKFICKFSINSPLILQTKYADFKEFYNKVVQKQNEPVVIKKI
jgi:hypothetical protein